MHLLLVTPNFHNSILDRVLYYLISNIWNNPYFMYLWSSEYQVITHQYIKYHKVFHHDSFLQHYEQLDHSKSIHSATNEPYKGRFFFFMFSSSGLPKAWRMDKNSRSIKLSMSTNLRQISHGPTFNVITRKSSWGQVTLYFSLNIKVMDLFLYRLYTLMAISLSPSEVT